MKKLIKQIVRGLGFEITRYHPNIPEKKCIRLKTRGVYRGNALLSYTINPFLLEKGEFDNSHIVDWHCFQIAKIFLENGYNVDVIDYHNGKFIPNRDYSFFIDVLSNMEKITPSLNKDCIKIFHPIFAHWLFHNSAVYQRHLELLQRKGIALKPARLLPQNLSVEYSDYVLVLGNHFTMDTYKYAQKPIYQIPNSAHTSLSMPRKKDYEASRRNFIWLGGNGLVDKGLDIALDAFTAMPDYHLYVCGPVSKKDDFGKSHDMKLYKTPKEDNFERAYYQELYQTPNIHTVGWVDIASSEFIDIANRCIGIVYPSSSEGQSGSVLNCTQAGLIPIISYESGVDVHDFGVILRDCSITTIQDSIKEISCLSSAKLREMSRKAWEYTATNHARKNFTDKFRKFVSHITTKSH
jgi:hypothetical protein